MGSEWEFSDVKITFKDKFINFVKEISIINKLLVILILIVILFSVGVYLIK